MKVHKLLVNDVVNLSVVETDTLWTVTWIVDEVVQDVHQMPKEEKNLRTLRELVDFIKEGGFTVMIVEETP